MAQAKRSTEMRTDGNGGVEDFPYGLNVNAPFLATLDQGEISGRCMPSDETIGQAMVHQKGDLYF